MKAIIIDDEANSRKIIGTILEEHCSSIVTVYEAANLQEGIAIIKDRKPDLVFLDIEMPEETGLRILDYFEDKDVFFQIIFISAYNEYAFSAFKLSAIDYLLKPVDYKEVVLAVNKAEGIIQKGKVLNTKFKELNNYFNNQEESKIRLIVPKGFLMLDKSDILYFQADSMYTHLYLKGDLKETFSKPLKYFVNQLEKYDYFFQTHRSFLINTNQIYKYDKANGIILSNGTKVPVAVRRIKALKKLIQDK